MTTARDIVNRALKWLAITDSGESPASADAADTLQALNDMMHEWKAHHIDVLHSDYTLDSTVTFFVPPDEGDSEYYGMPSYQGTWNASTNSPSLASSTGTEGHVYKVSVTGTTTLDDVSSWAAGEWLVFDGEEWVKGRSSRTLEQAIVALLAVRVAPLFGKQPSQALAAQADNGWKQISAMCHRTPPAEFDVMLTRPWSRRVGW